MESNEKDKQIVEYDPLYDKKIEFMLDVIGLCYAKRTCANKFAQEFNVALSTAYRYYDDAVEVMKAEILKSRAEHIAESVNTMRLIVRRATATGDHGAATGARKYMDSVIGLTEEFQNGQEKPVSGTNPGTNIQLDAESVRALGEAIARAKTADDGAKQASLGGGNTPND